VKISANWIRDFVSPSADDRAVAELLTVSGIGIEGYYNEGADLCYEAEVTTNRVDAMNHYGIAREVSAVYDIDLKPVEPKIENEQPSSNFPVEIEYPEGCARYTARVIRGVKIAPSPAKMAHRLGLLDQRSISNVADATNYVLFELGQPTHAYDLDQIAGGRIIVRHAREGEVLKTLDGIERKLLPEDIVIADAEKALGLAGIMGGEGSMITDATTNVLIEVAWFDPAAIRRTARRLGMHTDASHRYERGADCGLAPLANARVAELIQQTAGGVVEAVHDVVARAIAPTVVELHRGEVLRILGGDIAASEIERILTRLGFQVETLGEGVWRVTVPSWRLDVEREIDLIEEVARIYGYLELPSTLPNFAGAVVELPHAAKNTQLRRRLISLGYNESLSTTFISAADAKFYGTGEPVELANPLSDEAAVMRNTLAPNLLSQVAYNLNRGNQTVRLFELGNLFELAGAKVEQHPGLCFVSTGDLREKNVHGGAEEFGFYHLKGDVEQLLAAFDFKSLYFDRLTPGYYHPGRSARIVIDGGTVGRFGQVHPEIAARCKFRQPVYLAELMPERLFRQPLREPHYTPVPKFPAVERDFSFLFPEKTEFSTLRQAVLALEIPVLISFEPLEIFRGGNVEAGKYSLLLRARFQSATATLRDEAVAAWSARLVEALGAFGGTLRG
jgi:phenylalanyl-tRNA synthetase beta chain